MHTIGVTGVGFIGLYVVEELLDRGYGVVAFDHHKKPDGYYPEGVEVFLGDIRDATDVTEFAAHVDGIIHLAACLGTQETVKNPRPATETNILGGLNVLEAAAQYDLPVTYIGVGNHFMNNTYSITKTTIERFVDMYNRFRGTRVNVVRAVNAYGARQLAAEPFAHGKVRKITPAFVCRALSNMPIEIYGDGSQVSDMVYVGDVAKALVTSLEKANEGKVFGEAVEVGDGAQHTVKEVAELVIKLTGSEAGIKYLPMRPGENVGDKVFADPKTLKHVDMTVKDLMPLEDGMQATINYFKNTEGEKWHIAATK